jgi:hypothetical protein
MAEGLRLLACVHWMTIMDIGITVSGFCQSVHTFPSCTVSRLRYLPFTFQIYYSLYFYNYIDWCFQDSAVGIMILYEMNGLGFNSFGLEIFRTRTDRPRGTLSLLYQDRGLFLVVKDAGPWH